ncbi:MAG: ABC transporter ATP-binding protein [Alphaproteobacteria bacterium]
MQIEIQNLSHRYKNGTQALDKVNLTIKPGLLGFLGPNGAGKSTLMSVLATLLKPSEGTVLLDGHNIVKEPNSVRNILGYLPQHFGVYDQLSGVEFLNYMAAIKGIPGALATKRIDELMAILNLEHAKKQKLNSYSGGMRQRIGIAQALLNDPKLLIVDEPTVGLDPEERIRFRRLLADLAGERIVILSTHIVSDVASIASNIVIIKEGQIIAEEAPEDLLKKLTGKVWVTIVKSEQASTFEDKYIVSNTVRRAEGFELRIISDKKPTENAKASMATLEDCYLYFTRRHNNGAVSKEAA